MEAIDSLVGRLAGVITHTSVLPVYSGTDLQLAGADLGNVAAVFPHVSEITGGTSTRGHMTGAGGADTQRRARRLAAIEALERYASCVYSPDSFRWASATELGSEALALHRLPRCSDTEMADPRCLIGPARLDEPLRWTLGVDLHTREPQWIPAICTYLYINPASRAERLWLPISTGCAAHTRLPDALVSGILEVIERDAIALTWLQMLALPRIADESLPDWARGHVERNREDGVDTLLFDATTDLNIPIVYALELADHDPHAQQLLGCGVGLDAEGALRGALREAVSMRTALAGTTESDELPEDVDDFIDVMHGAVYMGQIANRAGFDFLLSQPASAGLPPDTPVAEASAEAQLSWILQRLEEVGASASAVDLTTDEALRAGFRVVRTIVPELQPLSFSPRTQFKGHERLYTAPARMGHPVASEEELNPWPQPFA